MVHILIILAHWQKYIPITIPPSLFL